MATIAEALPRPAAGRLLGVARAAAQSLRGWRYVAEGKRDLRLDYLRGFAVFAMVADHLGGASWLYALTGGNRFFVSAAEGFVLISGVVVGVVYGGLARKSGLRAALPKLLQRAWLLYAVAVWLALATALVDLALGLPRAAAFAEAPGRFVVEVLTLRRTVYLVDVMLLYAFLMLLTPPALALLLRGRWRLLALLSWGLWAAYQCFPRELRLPWPIEGNPVFNLAAWQVLFCTGLLLGYERERLARAVAARGPRSPLRDGWLTPLALLVGLLVWVHATNGAAFDRYAPGDSAAALLDAWFDKSALPPARLAACAVVFAFGWALVTRLWRPLHALAGPFLLVLGQGALYAYTAHLFLVAAIQVGEARLWGAGAESAGGGHGALHPGVNALIQLAGILVLWLLTRARVLQAVVAPLGEAPVAWSQARGGGRSLPRPGDPLVAILLVALLAAVFAAPGGSGSVAASTGGRRPRDTPAAPPASTVTAPRTIAGPAGAPAAPPTSTVTASRQVGDLVGRPSPAGAASTGPAAPTPTASAAPTAAPGGRLADGVFYSPTLGRTMPYGIYLPPGYDGGARRYPVLYMLHGAAGYYSEWVVYGLTETAERLIASGQLPPLIIVLPQGDRSYWANHPGRDGERWGDYVAEDLVAHVDATYRTLARRESRAVGGLSMGGYGALHLALTHPQVFAAAGAHSPALRTAEELADLCGDAAACASLDLPPLVLALDPATAPLLWLDVGEQDQWLPRVAALNDLVTGRGISHVYRVAPGAHEPAYWNAHVADYLRFYGGALMHQGPAGSELAAGP